MGSGFKTFTAGSVLTASDVNNYLMEQAVMVFSSSAARSSAISSPEVGMTTYLTDTGSIEVYYGATTGWKPPWKLPWGYVNRTELATTFTQSSSSAYDVTGMSVTFTAVANRFYRVEAFMPYVERVNGVATRFAIYNGNTRLQGSVVDGSNPGTFSVGTSAVPSIITTFSAGSTTVKCRIESAGGSGTMSVSAKEVYPYISVEDVGPSGNAPTA